MRTITEQFVRRAAEFPDRVCVHHLGLDFTYGQIHEYATLLATSLRHWGMQTGQRVVLLLPNSAAYVASYLGVQMAGGIVVALNPDSTAAELHYTFRDCEPVAALCERRAASVLADALSGDSATPLVLKVSDAQADLPLVIEQNDVLRAGCDPPVLPEVRPSDLAQIIYTSGTTGKPKGVTLSHRNIAENCHSIVAYLELSPEDSVLITLPFSYSYGNSLLFTHLAVGGRMVLADFVYWSRVLDLMRQQRVTGFSGVPSSFAMLLTKSGAQKRSFPHLRYVTCAGGALAPATVGRIREMFPGVRLYPMYGQTEATARLSTVMPDDIDRKPGSIGRGIPGVNLQVLDQNGGEVLPGQVGEIVASGENLMVGYWNDDEATATVIRDGRLWTGDLARVDEDGYIYIVGRRKNIIKFGAHRIHPAELEHAIMSLDGIAEVAVVGMPHAIWGESPTAFIVPSGKHDVPTSQDVIEHCLRHLSRHKSVQAVHFVKALPKTTSGKVKHEPSLYAELLANTSLQSDG